MNKLQKFTAFIDERIKLSKSKATKAAYTVVKTAFDKIFSESEVYDAILDMDLDSSTVTGTFVGNKRSDEVFEIVEKIIKRANTEHNEGCKRKDCPGVLPYLIPQLKVEFTSHPEYDIPTILAITACIHVEVGVRTQQAKQEVSKSFRGGSFGDLIKELVGESKVEIIDMTHKEEE